MTIIQSIILGIVEGLTEFLPVSSTGHLILTSQILGIAKEDFTKSFEISIQFGAILAVVVLYWQKLVGDKRLWKKILTAFIPTAIVGFFGYKILKNYLLSSDVVVVWALGIGGILLILFELGHKKWVLPGSNEITYKQSFLTGLFQSIAIIPGVSRSAATIVGGMLQGIERQTIVEFSFLLAVPTIAAASGYDLLKNASQFSMDDVGLLVVGFIVSFITAIVAIKWFLNYVKNHNFIAFGVYRIVIALLFWVFIIR